uniref:Uncharacterized protein n=1 Tax=Salmo trutta TaxID=8032 RepID=A0A673WDR9_SALTR
MGRCWGAISIQQCFSLCVLQLGVLHNVLEKLQNRRMAVWERRQSHLPSCIVGDYCTVKKGPRYGQLCDCPRGSKCNLFFLKCLGFIFVMVLVHLFLSEIE